MKIKHIANFKQGQQDGAIFKGLFFSINAQGLCCVYNLDSLQKNNVVELEEISRFTLHKSELICPHSNSVVFGKEYYSPDDEFPILYTNMYNNCSDEEDRHLGQCLAYRIQRTQEGFISTLVQIIEIGFVNNSDYWCSKNTDDVRPYGNFVVDTETDTYWAFTMRDEEQTTAYFSFDMPKPCDGVHDHKYGVKRVVLQTEDIKTRFDCPYHNYIQGACFNDGKVYSVEGFSVESGKKPALRIIDTKSEKQIYHINFSDYDLDIEPEMIDFSGERCYYSDAHGHMYELEF